MYTMEKLESLLDEKEEEKLGEGSSQGSAKRHGGLKGTTLSYALVFETMCGWRIP